MELMKLSFVQASGMLDQYIAPHAADFRGHVVDDFARATKNGSSLSAMRLAKHCSGLFVPDTSRGRLIKSHAPNGWDTDRLAFAMVVAINNRQHSKTYQYIVGYTDADMSSGTDTRIKLDSRMKLYFNNITRVHMNESVANSKRVWTPKIQTHDQILNRSSLTGFDDNSLGLRDRPVSLRPTDLFRRQTGTKHFARHFEEDKVSNMCGAFTSQLKASSRVNNSTSHYMHRTLSAYLASASDPDLQHHYDEGSADTLNHAHDRVEETDLELDPYIEEMKMHHRILDDGYITWGDLQRLNPDFDFDKIIFGRRKGRMSTENEAGWKGTDNESIAARIIRQSLPGIMINSGYVEVEKMVLDSTARVGQSVVEMEKAWPFVDGMRVSSTWPYFEGACRDILIHEVTCGGRFDVTARVDANIDRNIRMWIRVDNGPEAYFNFPAFMDAGVAPTLENDNKAFDRLAKGVVGLAADISARRLNDSPTHVDKPGLRLSDDKPVRSEPRKERSEKDW